MDFVRSMSDAHGFKSPASIVIGVKSMVVCDSAGKPLVMLFTEGSAALDADGHANYDAVPSISSALAIMRASLR